MVVHQLDGPIQRRRAVTLDLLCHPLWEPSDDLLQCDHVDDPLSGIPELLGERSAHLVQGQHAEALMMLL